MVFSRRTMRVFLTIIGAVAGLSLSSGAHELFGIVLGAFAGFAAGEFGALRIKLKRLEDELVALRKEMALRARGEAEPTETASPVRPVAPGPAHPTSTQVGSPPSTGAWEPHGVESRPGAPGATTPVTARTPVADIPAAARAGPVAAPNSVPPTASATVSNSVPPAASAMVSNSVPPIASATASSSVPLTASAAASRSVPPTAGAGYSGQRPPESAIDAIVRIVRDYFTGGNTLVRVGIIILFFGVAFLLRYAAEHSHVPIEFRLSGVALGGIVLLVLGWLLRGKWPGYALALQGGAVGILYLTVFAGLKIYSVLPPGAAFVVLVVLAAFSAALAVLQNSQAFALLAVSGGFLAPVLASTGQEIGRAHV